MTRKLIIIGMGGHSKVVRDVALRNNYTIVGYLDDREPLDSKELYLGPVDYLRQFLYEEIEFFIGIGNNQTRRTLAEKLRNLNVKFATLIDPSAIIGSGVTIGQGTLVMPGVIINSEAYIREQVIINTGATIDHDCVINNYAHVSPGVHLAGGVKIGKEAHIGIGVSIIPQIEVGEKSIIGAGAAVIKDIPSHSVAVGIPAKVINKVD